MDKDGPKVLNALTAILEIGIKKGWKKAKLQGVLTRVAEAFY